MYREVYFKELIMEASKPELCRMETGRASDVVPVQKPPPENSCLLWKNLSFGLVRPFN